jgi:SAM-dependent methyltransferase
MDNTAGPLSARLHPADPGAAITPTHPSRLPRDPPPPGPDGRPATRWTDPRVATAYANRDDDVERLVVWPALADAVRPGEPRRVSGRPDGMVLELGCGLGGLAQRLAEEHWLRVYAVDVSPTMHRLGAARFRDAWIVRTLPDRRGRLPLRRAQCTAAVVQRMLLHLVHPCVVTGLLTDARRVLRPGAPIAIVEADTRAAYADGELYVEHYRLRDGTTLGTTAWRHSPATIASCLASAGFAIEEIRPLPASPVESGTVQRIDQRTDQGTDGDPLLLYRGRAV